MRLDGSSVAVVYLGVGDSKRALYHLAHVRKELTQRGYGIGRYAGDPFFYDSIFSPGGQEAGGPTPPWGVVTMFTAFAELEFERILEEEKNQVRSTHNQYNLINMLNLPSTAFRRNIRARKLPRMSSTVFRSISKTIFLRWFRPPQRPGPRMPQASRRRSKSRDKIRLTTKASC